MDLKSICLRTIISFIVIILSCFGYDLRAGDNDLVINEFYPNAGNGESEWIELYNPTSGDVELDNYEIFDNTGEKNGYTLDGLSIKALGYLVLDKLPFGLNNNKDELKLIKNGSTIDSVSFGGSSEENMLGVPEKGKSISRIPNGIKGVDSYSEFKITFPTKGEENKKTEYSNSIVLSEIKPGVNQFIELYNKGDIEVNLAKWKIVDEIGKQHKFRHNLLSPKSYKVIYLSHSQLLLKDGHKKISLLDPDGEPKSFIEYENISSGLSFSFINENWVWAKNATPGKPNISKDNEGTLNNNSSKNKETLSKPSIVEKIDLMKEISEAKKLENGASVTVQGVVTAAPGVLSKQYFYMQDQTSGIQIYSYFKDFPTMLQGYQIRVNGEISEAYGEKRVKISKNSDIEVVSGLATDVNPIEINNLEFDSNREGQYVRTKGMVLEIEDGKYFISKKGEIGLAFKKNTDNKIRIKTGVNVIISGILTKRNQTFLILPIRNEDVKIITSEALPTAGNGALVYVNFALIVYVVMLSWNIFLKVKNKPTK